MRAALIILGLAGLANPPAVVAAPTTTSQPLTEITEISALDPAKLAIARQVAFAIWPDGTVSKVMGSMTAARTGMMDQLMKTTPKDLGVGKDKDSDKSLGDIVREKDPDFEERMAITNRVMAEEMSKLMTKMEPQLRESVAQLYARKFSLAELSDIAAFFRTTSGRTYAERLMPMMADPEYVKSMSGIVPEVMKKMPSITERIKRETAHLPEPKKGEPEAKDAELPST